MASKSPDPLGDQCRTDYRALEPNRTTLGQWDLQYTHGPKSGQYFEPVVKILNVQRYVPERPRTSDKPNKLLITLAGSKGELPKKWVVGPDTKRSIAEAVGSFVIQDWWDKSIALRVDPSIRFGTKRVGGIRAKRAPGQAPLTDEHLDAPVDEEKAAEMDEAAAAVFGDEEDES